MHHHRAFARRAICAALGVLTTTASLVAAQVRNPGGPVTVPPGGPILPKLPDVELVSLKVTTGPCVRSKSPTGARQFTISMVVQNKGPGPATRWEAWAAVEFTTNGKPISPSYPKGYSGYGGKDSAILGGPVDLQAGESLLLQGTASAPANTVPVTWEFHGWLVPGSKGDHNEANNEKVFKLTTAPC